MRDSTWETWKLSHAYGRIGSGTTPTSSDTRFYTDSDGTPWVTTAELRENYISATRQQVTQEALEDFPTLRLYKPGSVMMAMYGATIGRLGMIEVAATCNQACCVFEASDRFDNRFLYYWLWHRRSDLIAQSVGGGQPNLSQNDLREERAFCPPLDTQRRIAWVLDEKTARIDGLIAKKRELLDRLAEKRQALITQAVTKGLNHETPMEPSDIGARSGDRRAAEGAGGMIEIPDKIREAYRELPPGWKLEKLKFFADIRNSNVDKTISEDEELVRLCNYTDVYYNDRITPDLHYMEGSATEAEIERFQLKRDQVIITKDSEGWDDIGIPALVTENMPEVLCGYHLSVFEPGRELDGGFLAWLCRAEPLNDQFKLAANGVTRFGLGQYPMKNAFIALPPLNTQRRIARILDEKTARIDGLIERIEESVVRLEEYRLAQVTAAVTGQLTELS